MGVRKASKSKVKFKVIHIGDKTIVTDTIEQWRQPPTHILAVEATPTHV